ncbi:pyridoxamine 5'-phosphate oxidase family protein [Aeromicrobium alkaliterrae]|uniref:Pyridoxamine 5'-phosphate oxidase family protein n=1 Tax=Aeromicrobium alkaliterrae TaxID=302168 RepID=A0ABN2JF54_9ACTN
MSTSDIEHLVDLTKDSRFCMLTTTDADGTLVSRPMARQEVDLGVQLWFIATRDSRKVEHIRADPKVSVTVSSETSWVSLAGTAAVVDDVEKLRELWTTFAEAWIPDGPEDPNAILLRVDVESAEYWDNPGGRVATVISFVKSKITGEPYDGGDHAKIDGL